MRARSPLLILNLADRLPDGQLGPSELRSLRRESVSVDLSDEDHQAEAEDDVFVWVHSNSFRRVLLYTSFFSRTLCQIFHPGILRLCKTKK